MSILLAAVSGGILVFGLVLMVVSLISYKRTGAKRLLPVTGAFLMLLIKGGFIVLYVLEFEGDWLVYSAICDLPVMGLLAYSLLGP